MHSLSRNDSLYRELIVNSVSTVGMVLRDLHGEVLGGHNLSRKLCDLFVCADRFYKPISVYMCTAG